jgi:hypothetical protein
MPASVTTVATSVTTIITPVTAVMPAIAMIRIAIVVGSSIVRITAITVARMSIRGDTAV